MKKKITALLLAVLMIVSLTACGGSSKVTRSAFASSSSTRHLMPRTQGFMDALTEKLGDEVTFDEQNASGDTGNLCRYLQPVRILQGGSHYGQRHTGTSGGRRQPRLKSGFRHVYYRLRHGAGDRRVDGNDRQKHIRTSDLRRLTSRPLSFRRSFGCTKCRHSLLLGRAELQVSGQGHNRIPD